MSPGSGWGYFCGGAPCVGRNYVGAACDNAALGGAEREDMRMPVLHLVLLVLAFVSFALATAGVSARIHLIPLGLALWILTLIV